MDKIIEITEDVKLLETDVILEKGDRIQILSEDFSDYKYYSDQMRRALTGGIISFKFMSEVGESNWMTLDRESYNAFMEVFGDLVNN